MSGKRVLTPFTLFSASSMAGTLTSPATSIRTTDNIGIELFYTGTPTGTFTVQGTVDGTNWRALDFGGAITASGAGDTHLITINQCPFDQLRLVYTPTSGAGNLTATIMAKTVGT